MNFNEENEEIKLSKEEGKNEWNGENRKENE